MRIGQSQGTIRATDSARSSAGFLVAEVERDAGLQRRLVLHTVIARSPSGALDKRLRALCSRSASERPLLAVDAIDFFVPRWWWTPVSFGSPHLL